MAIMREAELTTLIHTIKDVKDLEQLKVFLQELILRLTRILKETSGTSGTSAQNVGKIKARAYRKNTAQNIDADSATKVLIDTIDRDTEGVVDMTNSRIIPNLPGYYVVMGSVCAGSEPSDLRINARIYKNGVSASDGATGIQDEFGFVSSSTSDLIYMNGTDDYLELWVHNNSSSASALAYSIEPTGCSINYISIVGPF